MSTTNPQIEEQLDKLAQLCCGKLEGESTELEDRTDELLKTLLMSGYVRKTGQDLEADIETRVKSICREPAMHRGGALSGITSQLQKQFDELVRWESRQPESSTPPKAANISSATDA